DLQSHDRQKADSELTEAVTTAGPFVLPFLALAQLKLDTGDPDAAGRYARRAKALNPNLPEARLLLANATKNPAEFKAAAEILQRLVSRNPGDAALRERLGQALLGLGDLPGAEAQFDAALKVQPDSTPALANLIGVYIAQKKVDAAIQRLNQLIAKDPRQPSLYQFLAQVYLSQKDNARAEENLKKATEVDSKNLEAKVALIRFYEGTRQEEKAISIWE